MYIIPYFSSPSMHTQEYLLQFNELWEELNSRKVGVFGICAQPQDQADKMVSENSLKFQVSVGEILLCATKLHIPWLHSLVHATTPRLAHL